MERDGWARQGIFLDPGLLPDQSAAFVDAMAVITAAIAEADKVRKERSDRAERAAQRAARGKQPGSKRGRA